MSLLSWEDAEVTVVKPTTSRVAPPPLPGAKREVPLAVTEVQGDERATWNFLKITMPVPMVRATQALPLVRMRQRRLIVAIPWIAMFCGALSGVILCWWLTLPKSPPVLSAQAVARSAITQAVAGVSVDGPEGARVEIDGVDRGTLPLRLEGLSPGKHRLRFDGRPAHGVLVREVELAGGKTTELAPVTL